MGINHHHHHNHRPLYIPATALVSFVVDLRYWWLHLGMPEMSFPGESLLRHSPTLTHYLHQTHRATFTSTSRYLAFSDYGSGSGDPRGEDPQSQGVSASADIEHPGPPPPAAGKGSGAGPTKGGDNQSHAGTSPNTESGNSQMSQRNSGSTRDTHPAILDASLPKEGEESKEVRDHNQEVIL
jgi:hypothetical protein